MNILSVDRITKTIGDKELFKEISFGLNEGEKSGLIGVNGSGKTTLFRIIAGLDEPDSGLVVRARALSISFLPQIPEFEGDFSVNHYIKTDRARAILHELGVENREVKISELSVGMQKKTALANILSEESNLLILDEPTNHLDIGSILWLQNHLQKSPGALLLVTHDRYFLENITDTIYELERNELRKYEGSYSTYLEKKALREEIEMQAEKKAARLYRSELEWLRRQPKARGTKQKARIDRADELADRDRPEMKDKFSFATSGRRLGNKILEVKNLGKSYAEKKLFSNFNHAFKQREHTGIVGPNGSGKSTFLNILTGRLEPDTGSVIAGVNTHFGYFDQTSAELDNEMHVLDYVRKNGGEIVETADGSKIEAWQMLEYFHFKGRMQHTKIARLSGGEKRRLYLVLILMSNPNFLILDEPTNDLDIATLSLLEDFLFHFGGCILVSSHDRYFLDRVADSLLVLDGNGKIEFFTGNCSEYLESLETLKSQNRKSRSAPGEGRKELPMIAEKTAPEIGELRKIKFTNKEKQEFQVLEIEIPALEKEKLELEEFLASPAADHREISRKGARLAEVTNLIDTKFARWNELSDRI